MQLQAYVPPLNIHSSILSSSLETGLSDIQQIWMLENKVKLNNGKIEALAPHLLICQIRPFQSPNPLPSLSVAVKSLSLLRPESWGFFITAGIKSRV